MLCVRVCVCVNYTNCVHVLLIIINRLLFPNVNEIVGRIGREAGKQKERLGWDVKRKANSATRDKTKRPRVTHTHTHTHTHTSIQIKQQDLTDSGDRGPQGKTNS